jgi:hypothetical protein
MRRTDEPLREANTLRGMNLASESIRNLSDAVHRALRSGVAMPPRALSGLMVSSDDVLVCAALPGPANPVRLAKLLMEVQGRRPHRYAGLQVALNKNARLCVLYRPAARHLHDPDVLCTRLGLMVELAHAGTRSGAAEFCR